MSSKKIVWTLLFANILIVLIMRPSGNALKHPYTPSGIVSLELAYDSTETRNILNAWDNDLSANVNLISQARTNIHLDFIFLVLYSSLLFFACRRWGTSRGKITRIMMGISITAGLLDIIENFLMLNSLNGSVYEMNSLFTFLCAILKFVLIILVMLFVLWSLVWNNFRNQTSLN